MLNGLNELKRTAGLAAPPILSAAASTAASAAAAVGEWSDCHGGAAAPGIRSSRNYNAQPQVAQVNEKP